MATKDKWKVNNNYGIEIKEYEDEDEDESDSSEESTDEFLGIFWYLGTEETKKLHVPNAQVKYFPYGNGSSGTIKIWLPDNEGVYRMAGIIHTAFKFDSPFDEEEEEEEEEEKLESKTITDGGVIDTESYENNPRRLKRNKP